MGTLMQRLRDLDRKVLREYRWEDPAFCAKHAARWWRLYLLASVLGIGAAVEAVYGYYGFIGLVGGAVGLAFQAGMLRAEHERIKNPNTFMGRRRPPGL
jgi:hypothetical protein